MRHLLFCSVLALTISSPILAQERSIALGLGYVELEDFNGTLWFTASARIQVANRFFLEPEVGYWNSKKDMVYLDQLLAEREQWEAERGSGFGMTVTAPARATIRLRSMHYGDSQLSFRDLNFGLHVLFQPVQRFDWTLGCGGGVHSFSGDAYHLGYADPVHEAKRAVHFLSGVGFPIRERISLTATIRYDLLEDWSQLKAGAGLRLNL